MMYVMDGDRSETELLANEARTSSYMLYQVQRAQRGYRIGQALLYL